MSLELKNSLIVQYKSEVAIRTNYSVITSQSKCLSSVNSPSIGSPNTEDENIVLRNPKREREEVTDSDYDSDSSSDEDVDWESIKRKREENEPGYLLAKKIQWDKINRKIQVLRFLIPNCPEASDMDTVLDRTIEYCKNQANIIAFTKKHQLPMPMMPYLCGTQGTPFVPPLDFGLWPAAPPRFMNPLPTLDYPATPRQSFFSPRNRSKSVVVSEFGDGEDEAKNNLAGMSQIK